MADSSAAPATTRRRPSLKAATPITSRPRGAPKKKQPEPERKEIRTLADKVKDSNPAPHHQRYSTAEGEAVHLSPSTPPRQTSTGELELVQELETRVQDLEDELRTTRNKLEYSQMKEAEAKAEVERLQEELMAKVTLLEQVVAMAPLCAPPPPTDPNQIREAEHKAEAQRLQEELMAKVAQLEQVVAPLCSPPAPPMNLDAKLKQVQERERRAYKLLLRLLGDKVLEEVLDVVETEGKPLADVAQRALTKSILTKAGVAKAGSKRPSNNARRAAPKAKAAGGVVDTLTLTRLLEERMKHRDQGAGDKEQSPVATPSEGVGKQRWFLGDLSPIVTQRGLVPGSLHRKNNDKNNNSSKR